MLIHGIQNTVADIVILHTGTKLNLLIATEKGITTSLGGGGGGGGVRIGENTMPITLFTDLNLI